MPDIKDLVKDYIEKSKIALLATAGEKNAPEIRVIGGYGNEQFDIYFSTRRASNKYKQILNNNNVTLFFQNEGQEIRTLQNVSVTGAAIELTKSEEIEKAVQVISKRYPNIKDEGTQVFLDESVLFKVNTEKIKFFDFSKTPATAEENI